MKSRLATLLTLVGLVAASCSSGNPIASVGAVTITDERVDAVYAAGDAAADFDCTLDFLIANEIYVEAARTRLGVTLSRDEIDEYVDSPPSHRVEDLAALGFAELSEDGLREQVRRWLLADRIVDQRVLADDALYAELVPADAPDGAAESPSEYIAPDDARAVLEDWVAEVVAEQDVAQVTVDPLFGSWTVEQLTSRDLCASAVLARVGEVGITEADVRALNDPQSPASQDEFIFELQFLISSELYVQEAAERFGIEVTDEEIESFIAAPPPHRVTALIQFQSTGRFSMDGVRAQVRRWILADEVVALLVRDDAEALQSIADDTGLTVAEIEADPLSYLSTQEANSIFNAWTTGIADAGEFVDVQVDPLFGTWDPVFRQLVPAGA